VTLFVPIKDLFSANDFSQLLQENVVSSLSELFHVLGRSVLEQMSSSIVHKRMEFYLRCELVCAY
jgi:hypothetical protein